ncbi:aminoacyl-tRNA deacylase [Candidatus Chrysopegis kryptomonas]|jgi:Ala-tRNA(Pro) deacylase|uniref:Ala-tRNA(Pro) deacylase n=1 Tax=Candidatus Chryseopegocella kryptomonas TaxID=1633643 RepID=A0A0P1MQG8_9BACT|nr:YbaK/EbsC family protein [Candidatus Chrysopegis kryptomonas]CUS97999.1 Ala-tRNA(Pro) deacylase [Candidatus Chrysopegis kryptomonas]
MPICERLKNYLDSNGVKYITIVHSTAFTSQEIAASVHIKGKEFAKCVIVKSDGNFFMLVIPSDHKINFEKAKKVLNVGDLKLATEDEFRSLFPDCETGAMPPFGNLYNVPVYMDEKFKSIDEISFNGGTHNDVVKMKMEDYIRLVNPVFGDISEHL